MSEGALTGWGQLDDAQMGAVIAALGPAVEPTSIDLVAGVRTAIDSYTPALPHERQRISLAVAAALILLAGIVVFSIAPARTAVANWLGIGSTSVVIVDELPLPEPAAPPTAPLDAPTTDEGRDSDSIRLAAAEQLDLAVLLPDPELVGAPDGWEIRDTGESRELVVAWERITLTARAPSPETPLRKFVTAPDAVVPAVLADGTPALWIEGFHIREAGDVVESVGNTLLWEAHGIEYRIFGELVMSEAIEIATSLQ